MNSTELRNLQSPLKEKYISDPDSAIITLKATGKLGEGLSCKVDTGKAIVNAGLHPATGGTGLLACSGDMLLEALVACAGVTLQAVATAIEIDLKGGSITAEGDLDFRGTLGVTKDVLVGFKQIRLRFNVDSTLSREQSQSLAKLTERYCVIYQTLIKGTEILTDYNFNKDL